MLAPMKFVFLPHDYKLPADVVSIETDPTKELPKSAQAQTSSGETVDGILLPIRSKSERPRRRVATGPFWR